MITQRLFDQLAEVQKGAMVRKLDKVDVEALAQQAALFLVGCPIGTEIRVGLSDRVANSYRGIPEATYVVGLVTHDGTEISVKRDRYGFGARHAIVILPRGYKVVGDGVHSSSGACDAPEKAEVVKCES